MKKLVNIFIGAMLIFSSVSSSAIAGEVLDNILSTKSLVVATDSNWPPQSFLNSSNEMDGFDVDVAREIARRLNVGIEFKTPSWDLITADSWQKRWDLHVGSLKPTKELDGKLDFPAVYYYTPAVVSVHQSSPVVQLSELSGKSIGAGIDTSYEAYLRGNLSVDSNRIPPFSYLIKNAQVKTYDSTVYALDELIKENGVTIDAVIGSMPIILDAIDNKNYPVKIVDSPVFYEPMVISIDNGDAEFGRKLSEIVARMHADGTLSSLSIKWYRVDYSVTK